jgi:cobyrinic acid a,c-diamide synthase
MTERLQSFGYQRLRLSRDGLLGDAGSEGLAHEFHHSVLEGDPVRPAWHAENLQGAGADEGYVSGNLLAGYAHLHFGAQPDWARAWVGRIRTAPACYGRSR